MKCRGRERGLDFSVIAQISYMRMCIHIYIYEYIFLYILLRIYIYIKQFNHCDNCLNTIPELSNFCTRFHPRSPTKHRSCKAARASQFGAHPLSAPE